MKKSKKAAKNIAALSLLLAHTPSVLAMDQNVEEKMKKTAKAPKKSGGDLVPGESEATLLCAKESMGLLSRKEEMIFQKTQALYSNPAQKTTDPIEIFQQAIHSTKLEDKSYNLLLNTATSYARMLFEELHEYKPQQGQTFIDILKNSDPYKTYSSLLSGDVESVISQNGSYAGLVMMQWLEAAVPEKVKAFNEIPDSLMDQKFKAIKDFGAYKAIGDSYFTSAALNKWQEVKSQEEKAFYKALVVHSQEEMMKDLGRWLPEELGNFPKVFLGSFKNAPDEIKRQFAGFISSTKVSINDALERLLKDDNVPWDDIPEWVKRKEPGEKEKLVQELVEPLKGLYKPDDKNAYLAGISELRKIVDSPRYKDAPEQKWMKELPLSENMYAAMLSLVYWNSTKEVLEIDFPKKIAEINKRSDWGYQERRKALLELEKMECLHTAWKGLCYEYYWIHHEKALHAIARGGPAPGKTVQHPAAAAPVIDFSTIEVPPAKPAASPAVEQGDLKAKLGVFKQHAFNWLGKNQGFLKESSQWLGEQANKIANDIKWEKMGARLDTEDSEKRQEIIDNLSKQIKDKYLSDKLYDSSLLPEFEKLLERDPAAAKALETAWINFFSREGGETWKQMKKTENAHPMMLTLMNLAISKQTLEGGLMQSRQGAFERFRNGQLTHDHYVNVLLHLFKQELIFEAFVKLGKSYVTEGVGGRN